MLRITKLTDYGVVLLTNLAQSGERGPRGARELAREVALPLPTVSKILKALAREGLLQSHRGAKGGYSLARRSDEITMAEIIGALEGPIAITECVAGSQGTCDQESLCLVRSNWQLINHAVHGALDKITLSRMIRPAPDFERWLNRSEAPGAFVEESWRRAGTEEPFPVREPLHGESKR